MKNKKQYPFLALVLYAFLLVFYQSPAQSGPSQQQDYLLTGTVTDSYGPLPGVHVLIKGTNTGTFTDKDGEFSLTVGPTNTLVFSYLGYHTLEMSLLGRTTLEVELQPEATQLQEVEVNAGYYTVKERERTGSISRVTAEEIGMQPVSNPLAALQGRMTGVNITQTSGVPGAGFNIQIRGRNSIREDGNEPLYVVDGVPFGSQSLGYNQVSTVIPGLVNPLNSLNPTDIESIEILKDADATAIYGSRGANGVVLITTKKGRSGKTRLDLSLYNGMGRVTRFMDQMDTKQYLEMRREAFANDGITEYPANAYDVNGTWDQNRYTDWQKELIGGTAYTQRAQISLSGGSENTSFLVSSSIFNETSVFKGDGSYKKGAVHTQLGHRSNNDKLTLNLSLNYTTDQNDQAGTDLTREALNLAPNAPKLYDRDGKLNWENGTWNNPLRHLESDFNAQTKTLVANSVVGYQLPWGFALKANLGYTETRLKGSKTLPNTIYNPAWGRDTSYSSIYLNNGQRNSWIVEPQLHWNGNMESLHLQILLGGSFQEQNSIQSAQKGNGFTSNNLIHNLGAASTILLLQDLETVYRYQAFFGRVNLNFHKKYFLNLIGRRDGSSRFGPDRQFATFGAIGAAWLFSEEDFIKNSLPFLSFGKLRGSYGVTGNDQIGDYQYLDTYTTTDNNYNGAVGLSPSRLYNPQFGWETNKKLEAGLELGLWQDRLFLTTSWYRNRSGSQLVGIPMPRTTGFSSLQANLDATVQNSGVELELSTMHIQKKGFNWTSSLNVSIPQNKLLSFPDLDGSTYTNRLVLGKSLNIRKLYRYTGIVPSTGIYGFEDVDGDGQLTSANDKPVIKELNPIFFGGLGNKITIKGWELDFFFQFVKQEGLNYLLIGPIPGAMINQPTFIIDRWQSISNLGSHQRYTSGVNKEALRAYGVYKSSSEMITEASFLRLKNISLSYTLPKEILGAADCRLYLQGQNLWTLTKYRGMDPETQAFGYLPPLRMMTLGIQLTL